MSEESVRNIPTEEQFIQQELERFTPFETRVIQLRQQYSSLTIAGPEDRDGYEAVKKALSDLRGLRKATDEEHHNAKDPILKAGRALDIMKAKIVQAINGIEGPLKDQKQAYEAEEERRRQEKKLLQDKRFADRSYQLYGWGAKIVDDRFVLEDAEVSVITLREADDDSWHSDIEPVFYAIWERDEQVRREELRQQQEAAEALRLEAEGLKKKKWELDRANEERIVARWERLQALGFFLNPTTDEWLLQWDVSKLSIPHSYLREFDEKSWQTVLQDAMTISKLAIEAQERERQINHERLRQQAIDEQRRKDAEAERLEEERLAQAGDKEKWQHFITELGTIRVPEARSSQYRTKLKTAREHLAEIFKL